MPPNVRPPQGLISSWRNRNTTPEAYNGGTSPYKDFEMSITVKEALEIFKPLRDIMSDHIVDGAEMLACLGDLIVSNYPYAYAITTQAAAILAETPIQNGNYMPAMLEAQFRVAFSPEYRHIYNFDFFAGDVENMKLYVSTAIANEQMRRQQNTAMPVSFLLN